MHGEIRMTRQLPSDLNAEKSVLGACLLNKKAVHTAMDRLKPESFFIKHHQDMFQAMCELYEQGKSIDIVSLADHDIEYLQQLIDFVPNQDSIKMYVDMVADTHRRRKMIAEMSLSIEQAFTEDNIRVAVETAERALYEATEDSEKKNIHISTAMDKAIERLERVQAEGEVVGIKTGFPSIDSVIGSMMRKELVVIAARPSQGKSALAINMVERISKTSDHKIQIFSLEMGDTELSERMMASESGVGGNKYRTGKLTEDDWEKLVPASENLSKTNVFISDDPYTTIQDMRAVLRKTKPDAVVIDYLQLIKAKGADRRLEINNITRGCKLMAKEFDCVVILLSQLNRNCEQRGNKRPMMSDLKESGSIEEDSDIIMFIYRESVYSKDKDDRSAEIEIAKSRATEKAVIKSIRFRGDTFSFYDME